MLIRTEKEIRERWVGDITKPLVSICSLTFNHEAYIEEALDSFLAQETNFPFEIIINDDASSDKTVLILKEYAKKYPNIIKPIYQEENLFSKSINPFTAIVIPASKGEYIAICDGDDYWIDNKKLQIQLDKMKEYPDCHLSFHPVYKIINKEIFSNDILGKYSKKDKVFTAKEIIVGAGGFCPTSSILLKAETVRNLPNWMNTIDIAGDYFLQIYASLNGGALYINNILSIYRAGLTESWCGNLREDSRKCKKTFQATNEALFTLSRNTENFPLDINKVIHENHLDFIRNKFIDYSIRKEMYQSYKREFYLKDKALWYLIYNNPKIHDSIYAIRQVIKHKVIFKDKI